MESSAISRHLASSVSVAGVNRDHRWCDWAGLQLMVDEVADRVLCSGDVMDLLQFRSVCTEWWKAAGTPDPKLGPRVIDHRFHPRRWILVPPSPEAEAAAGGTPTRRQLHNVATGKLVQVDLPKLAGHTVVEGPSGEPEGMLVLRDESTLVVRLLNPVTGHVVDLPSLTMLRRGRRRGPIPRAFKAAYRVTAAGFAGDYSTVVVCLGHVNRIAMAKPGDKRWTSVNNLFGYPSLPSPTTFQGRFYCLDCNGINVLDVARRRLQSVAGIPIAWFIKFIGGASMVDHDGDLMLVWPSSRTVPVFGHDGQLKSRAKVTQIELFHVDLEHEGRPLLERMLPVRDLGEDAALFVGSLGAVLLPNARHCRSSSVHANTVYFKFNNMREKTDLSGAFQLSTNREANDLPPVEECRFARHIASYVSSTSGRSVI